MKILTIGNSFTESLKAYFPQVCESAGVELEIDYANHGGCQLSRHWEYIENEERDPVYRMYRNHTKTMGEILRETEWDVVTIQQSSPNSWIWDTYQPYGENIRNYINQHAPQAEVVIQQTWSYRADDPRISPGGIWNIDQNEMYSKLTENYKRLAEELGGLRIIPTGKAVQLARQKQQDNFVPYDPELLTQLKWPDLPRQANSLVGRIWWHKNQTTGKLEIARDTIHLNQRGQYLQACVWFAFFFKLPTSSITFVPDIIDNDDAEFLRNIAQEAVN